MLGRHLACPRRVAHTHHVCVLHAKVLRVVSDKRNGAYGGRPRYISIYVNAAGCADGVVPKGAADACNLAAERTWEGIVFPDTDACGDFDENGALEANVDCKGGKNSQVELPSPAITYDLL